MSRIAYRPDIDGLRAVAIALVFLNHLQTGLFPGGYIGVDVFFVISGYLITSIIFKEITETGDFSFAHFYIGRVRRLLPAIVVTCALVLVVAFLISTQEEFSRLSRSVPGALLSYSNIHFWLQEGYFDSSNITKPLLHAWSLSVEEQFYLFWPLTLLLASRVFGRARALLLFTCSLMLFSFFLNWLVFDSRFFEASLFDRSPLDGLRSAGNSSYFLTPFRVFEFGFGILLALRPITLLADKPLWCSKGLFAAGMLLVVVPAMVFDEHTVFPYYNALIPCAGTALLILVGQHPGMKTFLHSAPALYLGRISYSLYLVHWPIIVFYHSLKPTKFTVTDQLIIILLAWFLAHLLHHGVEQPLRRPGTGVKTAARDWVPVSIMGSTLLVLILSLSLGGLFPERVPDERQYLTNKEWRALERRTYCNKTNQLMPEEVFPCQNYRGKEQPLLIWGDSHSLHLVAGFSEIFTEHDIYVATLTGCVPQSGFEGYVRAFVREDLARNCVERNQQVMRFLSESQEAVSVLITSAKRGDPQQMAEINNKLVMRLESMGHRAATIEDFIRPGVEMGQCATRPDYLISQASLDRLCEPDMARAAKELRYNAVLQEHSRNYVSVDEYQCAEGRCIFLDDLGRPTHRDQHHLSIDGSIYFISRLEEVIRKAI